MLYECFQFESSCLRSVDSNYLHENGKGSFLYSQKILILVMWLRVGEIMTICFIVEFFGIFKTYY